MAAFGGLISAFVVGRSVVRNAAIGRVVLSKQFKSKGQIKIRLPSVSHVHVGTLPESTSRILVFPKTVSVDCFSGTVAITDAAENVLAQVELSEPEPYHFGGKGRSTAWWGRGALSRREPISISIPSGLSYQGPISLLLNLRWNFIGTRIEEKIPKDQEIVVEVAVC